MTQLVHKYAKCNECGREEFMWGMLISISARICDERSGELTYTDTEVFICHACLKHLDEKLNDMEEEVKNKTSVKVRAF